jgi:hypothetical protein
MNYHASFQSCQTNNYYKNPDPTKKKANNKIKVLISQEVKKIKRY